MWPRHQHQQQPDLDRRHYLLPSSSSSSSSSSSFPSFHPAIPQTPRRTMDEVWKDITLNTASPIAENITHQAYFHQQANNGICLSPFRDFLAKPVRPIAAGSIQPAAPPPGSAPATVLSLNSGTGFRYVKAVVPGRRSHTSSSSSFSSSSSSISAAAFSDSPSPGVFVYCNNKKRASPQQLLDPGTADSRNKRMVKNRESAARSRARKQAYTNELELEVNHLTEENEMLRRQHEELRAKMAAQMTTKRVLQRSSTAPF